MGFSDRRHRPRKRCRATNLGSGELPPPRNNERRRFFATLVGTFSLASQSLVGFAFVDDTDLCVTHPSNQAEAVAKHMQGSVLNWEGLLRATGGALVPDKCFWYLLDFEEKNGRWKYRTNVQLPGTLYIHDASGIRHNIPRLEANDARRTLGVRITPDGNMDMELNYLQSVARDWQAKMAKSKLSQNDAMFSLRQVIYRKLSYPLLTTTFSAIQCQTIMSPILGRGLPAAGVVRSFPQVLAHGPLTYGGLDLPNLHTEQTIAHILQVLSSTTSEDTTAFLLRTCGEYM